MNGALRLALAVALLGSACAPSTGGTRAADAPADPNVEVGRVALLEVNHGYVVVQFANRRMNVTMDKREMGEYIVGDEIRIDSYGRPLPRKH